MELNKFVQHSIISIMQGLKGAQEVLKKESCAIVCPKLFNPYKHGNSNQYIGENQDGRGISSIEFDVAVEASKDSEKGGGISVLTGLFGGDAKVNSSQAEKLASRIRFQIPVCYPDIDEDN